MRKFAYRFLYMVSGAALLMALALLVGEQPATTMFVIGFGMFAIGYITENPQE